MTHYIIVGIYLYPKVFSLPFPNATHLSNEGAWQGSRHAAGSLKTATHSESAAFFQILKKLQKLKFL
jgi:hypothetical protein